MRWSWIVTLVLAGCGAKKDNAPAGGSGSNAPVGSAIAPSGSGSGSAAASIDAGSAPSVDGGPAADNTGMQQPEPQGGDVEQLLALHETFLVRTHAGDVYAWGTNKAGTVGDGTGKPRLAPVKILAGVAQLAGQYQTACARMTDGTVQCWGSNDYRQAGDASASKRNAPGPVTGVAGATAIFVGGVRACASVADGKLVCWGNVEPSGLWSERHETKTATPVEVKALANVTQIDDECVLHSDGTVSCWGLDLKPRKVGGIAGATHIESKCARLGSRKVACWGDNDVCRLGKPRNQDSADDAYASAVPMASVKAAEQIFDGGCALEADGTAWCQRACDSPGPKQLAIKNVLRFVERCVLLKDSSVACASTRPTIFHEWHAFSPKPVPDLGNIYKLAVFDDVACALRGTSDVLCWGDRKKRGLVGDGAKQTRDRPVQVLGATGPMAPAATGSGSGSGSASP